MTARLNDLHPTLHPTPVAEMLANLEMQPDRYIVLSLGSNFSRPLLEDAVHARVRGVFAFGNHVSPDEIRKVLVDLVALVTDHLKQYTAGHPPRQALPALEPDDDTVPDEARALAAELLHRHAPDWPPLHTRPGSDPARAAYRLAGHCNYCCVVGHRAAHPDLSCTEVGCDGTHPEEG